MITKWQLNQEDQINTVLRTSENLLGRRQRGRPVCRNKDRSGPIQGLHTVWSLRPGPECSPLLPRCPARSPQTPGSCCPWGPAPHGWCRLKEMSTAPEKVLRNPSPCISWLWGVVIKACLLGLLLALKNLVVLPRLSMLGHSTAPLIPTARPSSGGPDPDGSWEASN